VGETEPKPIKKTDRKRRLKLCSSMSKKLSQNYQNPPPLSTKNQPIWSQNKVEKIDFFNMGILRNDRNRTIFIGFPYSMASYEITINHK
jgi:hypothetical protein